METMVIMEPAGADFRDERRMIDVNVNRMRALSRPQALSSG
jgi:hypothetical protein